MRTESPFAFSQSSLQDYSDCPRRFQLRYLQDLVWPAVEAEPLEDVERRQREGQLFHRMVQQWYLGISPESLAAMATSANLRRWWDSFMAAGPDVQGWKLSSEEALGCRIGSHRLVCKYDLVAVRDGKALVYDWKTYARHPRDEWLAARMQTRVYRAMLVRAGAELNGGLPFAPADVSMIYWFAEFPNDPTTLAYDGQQHARDWEYLEQLVSQIATADNFPLTGDLDQCRFCNYRSLCDRGQQPGMDPEYENDTTAWVVSEDGPDQVGEIQI